MSASCRNNSQPTGLHRETEEPQGGNLKRSDGRKIGIRLREPIDKEEEKLDQSTSSIAESIKTEASQ